MTNLQIARAEVNRYKFGSLEWESAIAKVRSLVAAQDAAKPRETFHSVDNQRFLSLRALMISVLEAQSGNQILIYSVGTQNANP